jgi:hypothetical protein
MSNGAKIVALATLIFAGGIVLWFMPERPSPVGGLSRNDVLEIRDVVSWSMEPHWNWLTRANFKQWPGFVLMRLRFRIIDLKEDSIDIVIIHPDGTREEPKHPVTVWFKTFAGTTNTCRVERRKGQWVMSPVSPNDSR